MPEHPQYQEGDIFNPETHHEESDVNVRALLWFFVIFVVSGVVTHIFLWFLYKGFVKVEKRNAGEALTSMQRPADANVPKNEPLLQPFPVKNGKGEPEAPYHTTPPADLAMMRKAEQQALTNYGWVDEKAGVVRIPIADAKRLVVERGLPVQAATAVPAGAATTTAATTSAPSTTTAAPATTQTTGGPQ